MAFKEKGVKINVGKDFFDRLFEPARRDLERELGVRVSQKKFTSMVLKSGIKFKPKLRKFIKNGTSKNKRKKR